MQIPITLQTPRMRHNFHHLYADVFWYGVLAGSVLAFLNIYVARLGATSFHMSLLTAAPAVTSLLFSLPAGKWLHGKSLLRATFWSSAWHRVGYLALIPLPWLLNEAWQIWAVIVIVLLMSIPGTVLVVGFFSMFGDIVPGEWRGEVTGKRNAIMSIGLTVTTLLCGRILEWLEFPLGYQVVFLIGAIGAGMSTYHLGRLRPAKDETAQSDRPVSIPPEPEAAPGIPGNKPNLNYRILGGSFGLFLVSYLVFYTFQYLPIPLFPLIFVNSLRLTDGMISLGSTLFYLIMFLVSLRLGWFSARLGHHRVLVVGALGYAIYPLLIGSARGPSLYLVASLVGGSAWAITNAGLINRLLEKAPEKERSAAMAFFNLALNVGILAGSFSGPVISDWIGLKASMFVSGGLRFLAGLLLGVWG